MFPLDVDDPSASRGRNCSAAFTSLLHTVAQLETAKPASALLGWFKGLRSYNTFESSKFSYEMSGIRP